MTSSVNIPTCQSEDNREDALSISINDTTDRPRGREIRLSSAGR